MARYDCIIIGGGHNGLACAAYLARSGRRTLVLEASDGVGGFARTREFADGFRASCAHFLHMMPNELMRDLRLGEHGLTLAADGIGSIALGADGNHLRLGDRASVAHHSSADAAALPAFRERMGKFAALLHTLLREQPPRLATTDWADQKALLKMALRVRLLGRRDMRELLRIIGMNAYDLLEEHFESDLLKGALGFDAVLGANLGPRSPGTVLTLLYRLAAESGATGMAQPQGGMGGLADALAAAARSAGADIRTNAAVAKILVEKDHAKGVVLASGETIESDIVVSNADPKTTFMRLLGTEHLDTGFVRRMSHLRSRGLAAKLHLALDKLPVFPGLEAAELGGRLLISPSLTHLERAYNATKYDDVAEAPVMEATLPSLNDPSLAPRGGHVLSAVIQFVPYGLAGDRERLMAAAVNTLDRHAPGLKSLVRAAELLTPPDLERTFLAQGGHWHHADLAFDQFFMIRPTPGATQYRTPLPGLFLCGAGSHPGGGVMGAAGRNAARRILAEAS